MVSLVNIHFESHQISRFSYITFRPNGPRTGYNNLSMERGGDEPGKWGGINLPQGRVYPAFSGSASLLGRGDAGIKG